MHERSERRGRVQDLLPLTGIDRDVVWLRGGGCRAALAVSSINFALKAVSEQEAVVAGYRAFLNGLRFPLQVLVRVESTDVEHYLAGLHLRGGVSAELARLALDHEAFVRRLARDQTLLERRFSVIIPAGDDPVAPLPAARRRWPWQRPAPTPHQHAALAVRELATRCRQVVQGLAGLGLDARRLTGAALAALWYTMLTPDRARRQPLPPMTGPVAMVTHAFAEEVAHVR